MNLKHYFKTRSFQSDVIMNFRLVTILKEAVLVYFKVLPPRGQIKETTGNLHKDSRLICLGLKPGDSLKISHNWVAGQLECHGKDAQCKASPTLVPTITYHGAPCFHELSLYNPYNV
jgi:hypothetical protein